LSRGSDGHVLFRPQNDATREVDLQTPGDLLEKIRPRSAEGLSLDQIKQLPEYGWTVPTRTRQVDRLKSESFDVIVIGGGATGTGTALEAARRGLKVAALEAWDFSAGTSSKSTKLIHGGVRYLEKAVKNLDKEQFDLVQEGLHERGTFLEMAPHLTDEVKLVTPCYKAWEVPYFFAGLWLYDRIAGQAGLSATRMMTAGTAKQQIPELKDAGLAGAVEYSDGEFNDSRMNVGLAVTAAAHGAAVANYIEVLGLVKDAQGKVTGVDVRDKRTGDTFQVKGKVVVNATGPYIDAVRKMDDPQAQELVVPSAGTHIFVPKLKMEQGVLIPAAPNGSVAFFKPFEGGTLIGTTEEKTSLTIDPQTTQDQVEYLRTLANDYLDAAHQIQPSDITSVWTGIRPLVRDPKKTSTQELCRNHLIDVSPSGLVTIGGGKWTSFQRMAEETVDAAIASAGLPQVPTQREGSRVVGAHGYHEGLAQQLQDRFGLDAAVAEHLSRNYGDRAIQVAEIAAKENLGARLAAAHPYLEAEAVYAARFEYAQTPADVLSRRTRLSFLDEAATQAALPRVAALLAKEFGWDEVTAARELKNAQDYYQRNGLTGLKQTPQTTPTP
ncbi:MAG: FAD-dependent oxidoreductase, partial [Candidatus Eremiobacterota bacterium]